MSDKLYYSILINEYFVNQKFTEENITVEDIENFGEEAECCLPNSKDLRLKTEYILDQYYDCEPDYEL